MTHHPTSRRPDWLSRTSRGVAPCNSASGRQPPLGRTAGVAAGGFNRAFCTMPHVTTREPTMTQATPAVVRSLKSGSDCQISTAPAISMPMPHRSQAKAFVRRLLISPMAIEIDRSVTPLRLGGHMPVHLQPPGPADVSRDTEPVSPAPPCVT